MITLTLVLSIPISTRTLVDFLTKIRMAFSAARASSQGMNLLTSFCSSGSRQGGSSCQTPAAVTGPLILSSAAPQLVSEALVVKRKVWRKSGSHVMVLNCSKS